MSKKLPPLQSKAFDSLIQEVHQFHGQEIYSTIGLEIARKKPIFQVVFKMISIASKWQFSNLMMVAYVVIAYKVLREPCNNFVIFQYGVAENNIAAFLRLNQSLDPEVRSKASINGRRVPFLGRLRVALSIRCLWHVARVLTVRRHTIPLVHLQSVLAAAAAMVYSVRPLDDNIRLVCVASDHSPICMALLAAARQQGKATCYLQHAPVTEYFPPLTYDLSVLFDRASVEAYRKAAIRLNTPFNEDAITILPPFGEVFRVPQVGAPPYRIGICLSFLPNFSRLEDLVASLSVRADVASIYLRRHPRCRHDWSFLASMPKVDLRSKDETGVDFFAAVDIALVPNSGVAIEAMHYGRSTFFVPETDALPNDYYGFVAKGILPVFSCDALELPTEFFDAAWQEQFKQYDETAATSLTKLQLNVRASFMNILEDPNHVN